MTLFAEVIVACTGGLKFREAVREMSPHPDTPSTCSVSGGGGGGGGSGGGGGLEGIMIKSNIVDNNEDCENSGCRSCK